MYHTSKCIFINIYKVICTIMLKKVKIFNKKIDVKKKN